MMRSMQEIVLIALARRDKPSLWKFLRKDLITAGASRCQSGGQPMQRPV